MVGDVDTRLRRLEDIATIRDLLTRYGRLLDARDLAGYAALFARDGEWTGPFIGSAKGPAAILALLQEELGPAPPGSNHVMSNMVIEVDGDSGIAWSRWTYSVPARNGGAKLAISGRYDDRLVREEGAWRFCSRTVSGDFTAPDL